jgi:hypothetical protein
MQRALAQSLLWVRGYTLQELQQQANWCRVQRPAEQGWMEGGPYYYQAGDPPRLYRPGHSPATVRRLSQILEEVARAGLLKIQFQK